MELFSTIDLVIILIENYCFKFPKFSLNPHVDVLFLRGKYIITMGIVR